MEKVPQLHDLGVARQKYLTCTIWGGTPFLAWQKRTSLQSNLPI
jgi:hypothetical protein